MNQNHPFVFRPGTNDEAMFRHLCTHNEYRLPESFGADDVVMDVGVHIGSFSYGALLRGAKRVYGFEAEPSNFACAARNLASFGDRFRLTNKAVWRSDRPGAKLAFSYSEDPANTGGGSVVWEGSAATVETVPLDEAILAATDGGRGRVRLLKIDCEGSEFPILLTAGRLDLIDEIAGEFHEYGCARKPEPIPAAARVAGVPEFTVEALAEALGRAGFATTWERHEDTHVGLFFARRAVGRGLGGRLRTMWRHLTSSPKSPHFGPRPAETIAERNPR